LGSRLAKNGDQFHHLFADFMYDHKVSSTKQNENNFQKLAQWQVICQPIAAPHSSETVTEGISAQTACWVSYIQLTYVIFMDTMR